MSQYRVFGEVHVVATQTKEAYLDGVFPRASLELFLRILSDAIGGTFRVSELYWVEQGLAETDFADDRWYDDLYARFKHAQYWIAQDKESGDIHYRIQCHPDLEDVIRAGLATL